MKILPALILLLVTPSCAVVSAVSGQAKLLTSWAEGLAGAEGEVVDGEQQGEWTFFGEDGEKRAEGQYRDDVQDGPWVYYYPDGSLEYEGTFQDELREGAWRYWHPNGSPKAQGSFRRGRELGAWRFWDPQGQLTQRGRFLDGLQTHRWTYWRADGSRSAEGWFVAGRKVGVWSFWDEAGELSQRDYGLAPDQELSCELWPEGTLRREGLVLEGRPSGYWILNHRSGGPRGEGVLEGGLAEGTWTFFHEDGRVYARGETELGRPVGAWTVTRGTSPETWSAAGTSPAPPMVEAWSEASLVEAEGPELVLTTWLAEVGSDLEGEGPAVEVAASTPAPRPDQVQPSDLEPEVPVNAQPWTQRELEEFDDYVRAYTEIGADRGQLSSRYSSRRSGPSEVRTLSGDADKAREFLGKPLPLTLYRDHGGVELDLESLRGTPVVLVVLRGFGGRLCVYCCAQTEALCEANAFEEIERLGAKLFVLFPLTRPQLDAFRRGYQQLVDEDDIPPYGLLYQNDGIVGPGLGLEGRKVIPSTFILDGEGIVRFAYIGEHIADRPPVELVMNELRALLEAR